ncbi:unnamed protein product [Protopolystoma xenopodis]|uniref:Uncharacterized protein n=1 Tax=Protopolystoma xenopodis TaxID=117903 RepID=A0A3S5B6H9_9PLAT|nr:unnamed protein product [Protopolystoma xenopodis]
MRVQNWCPSLIGCSIEAIDSLTNDLVNPPMNAETGQELDLGAFAYGSHDLTTHQTLRLAGVEALFELEARLSSTRLPTSFGGYGLSMVSWPRFDDVAATS